MLISGIVLPEGRGPDEDHRRMNDDHHLGAHLVAGHHYFVTKDYDDIVKKRDWLRAEVGIKVATLPEAVDRPAARRERLNQPPDPASRHPKQRMTVLDCGAILGARPTDQGCTLANVHGAWAAGPSVKERLNGPAQTGDRDLRIRRLGVRISPGAQVFTLVSDLGPAQFGCQRCRDRSEGLASHFSIARMNTTSASLTSDAPTSDPCAPTVPPTVHHQPPPATDWRGTSPASGDTNHRPPSSKGPLSIRGAADRRASSNCQPCSANPTAESAAPVRSSASSPSTRGGAV